jgi:hypothetical protein
VAPLNPASIAGARKEAAATSGVSRRVPPYRGAEAIAPPSCPSRLMVTDDSFQPNAINAVI